MGRRPRRVFDALLEAVADGEDVDWDAAASQLRASPFARVAGNLRTLPLTTTSESLQRTRAITPQPLWRAPFAALALLQVCGGLLALAWVPPDAGPIPPLLLAANAAIFALAALALPVIAPGEARVSDLAGLYLAIAAACSHRPLRWLVEAGHQYWALVWIRGLLPDAFLPLFLWHLARRFPRLVRLSRTDEWLAAIVRVSGTVAAVLFVANAVAYIARPTAPWTYPGLGSLTRPHSEGLYWRIQFASAVLALVMISLRGREASPAERRRTTLFVAGLAIGLAPLLLIILMEYLHAPAKAYIEGPGLYLVGYAIYVPILTVPFTTGYALVARQMPPLGVLARSLLKGLIAPRTLRALAVLPLPALGFYAYLHRAQSAAVVLGGPVATALIAVAAAAVAALLLRDRLIGRMPFFISEERRYSSVLAGLGTATRSSVTISDAAQAVASSLALGIRAEWASIFVRKDSEARFVSLLDRRRALACDSGLARIMESSERPLLTDPRESGSAFDWLPGPDRDWLVDNEIAALTPLAASSSTPMGFIAVGPKREDIPWTSDDRLFLAAVSGPAAFALEARGVGRETAKASDRESEVSASECPDCGLVSAGGLETCSCGARLVECRLPPVLSAKFRVERVVGRGGMGVVYRGHDLELQRPVALKTLPRVTAEASLRLRQEARSMAALVHPNVAMIFGAESWKGLPVLIVEYFSAGTLRDRLSRPAAVRDVIRWGVDLARALEAMHAKGMLHRDVKPSNIGFTEAGEPKLLDFGLARLVADAVPNASVLEGERPLNESAGLSLTASGHLVGTPLYLSPEALQGADPGPEQDLWALSLVLYEAVSGIHPWSGAISIGRANSLPPLPDIRSLNGEANLEMATFFTAALAPRPEHRPHTASELRRDLERLLVTLGN